MSFDVSKFYMLNHSKEVDTCENFGGVNSIYLKTVRIFKGERGHVREEDRNRRSVED